MLSALTAEIERRCLPAPSIDIALEGDFDRASALRVRDELRRTPHAIRVHVDFRRVHFIQDVALAALAETLRSMDPARVILHGLGHHQELMLRYLGIVPTLCP